MMRFANVWLLILVLLVPVMYFARRVFSPGGAGSFRFPSGEPLKGLPSTFRTVLARRIIHLRALTLILIVVALARPQSLFEERSLYAEGIDVILLVDVSSSMRAHDLKIRGERVDRLEVVKEVVTGFIRRRPNDRIGVVAFSGYAYTVCPLTLDHDWLLRNIERIEIGMIEDGTAIGSAVAGALNRLRGSEDRERVVILLTDGRNNAGRIAPMTAAEAARAMGVRLYAVGVGTKGLAPFPFRDRFGNIVMRPVNIEIDEELLKEMAHIAGGEYFRAESAEALEEIYAHIDQLERTRIEHTGYRHYAELFKWPLLAAFALLLLELLLAGTVARGVP